MFLISPYPPQKCEERTCRPTSPPLHRECSPTEHLSLSLLVLILCDRGSVLSPFNRNEYWRTGNRIQKLNRKVFRPIVRLLTEAALRITSQPVLLLALCWNIYLGMIVRCTTLSDSTMTRLTPQFRIKFWEKCRIIRISGWGYLLWCQKLQSKS